MSVEGAIRTRVQGMHLCLDLHDCDPRLLDDPSGLQTLLTEAATRAGAHILDISSHHFEPQGVTMVLLLAESHLAIHTWPEDGFAAMDIFTCGPTMHPQVAADLVIDGLGARRVDPTMINRGGLRPGSTAEV